MTLGLQSPTYWMEQWKSFLLSLESERDASYILTSTAATEDELRELEMSSILEFSLLYWKITVQYTVY